MADYRVLVGDLLTNVLREEIPFSSFSYSHALNRPGQFSGSIGLRHPKATRTNLAPAKTCVYVERDSVLIWGGILWTADPSQDSVQLSVGGEGDLSYFAHRLIRETKSYAQQDQLFIARDLVNYAQAQPSGNIGITVGTETSGALRDRTYYGYERKNLLEALQQLAAVENGFDIAVDVAYSGGNIVKTLDLSYPSRGRRTELVFDAASNVRFLRAPIDGTRMARVVDVIGAGEGDSMLISTAQDADFEGYPRLEAVRSVKDVNIEATLNAHALAGLALLRNPVEIPEVQIIDNETAPVGSFITGDEVRVRGSDGYISIDSLYRIMELSVAVDQNGDETVNIKFASTEAFV